MRRCQWTYQPRIGLYLSLAIGVVAPSWARSSEPLEMIRAAYLASSEGLKSGIGQGRYRSYQAIPGQDWQLEVDAEVSTHFEGNKYHIDLSFLRDNVRHNTSSRIICDGKRVTTTWFSPSIHPLGAHTIAREPELVGEILCRPDPGTFPWDVAHLSSEVWKGHGFYYRVKTAKIDIKQTPEGDLVGENPSSMYDLRAQIECPSRFGFNLGKARISIPGEDHPRFEFAIQWKQHPSGLWYVTSLQQTFELRNEMQNVDRRLRQVLMYSRFEPNAKVDRSLFTEGSLQMPDGCRIIESAPGKRRTVRIYRAR
jgi:hypothetical protein